MPTEVWTLPRVAKVIRNEFGVGYHPGHVSKVLSAMGFSCQRPSRRAIERDEEKIRHWKRHKWPAIKKKPVAKGV
jgi:transposase